MSETPPGQYGPVDPGQGFDPAYGYPTSGIPQQPGYAAPGYPPPGDPGQAGYAQPGYAAPGYPPQPGYPAPYPGQPMFDALGRPLSDKSKLAAGLLSIFLGCFGVGRFYTGHVGIGVAQLLITVCTLGVGAVVSGIWGLIDGILVLVNGGTDAQGRVLRD